MASSFEGSGRMLEMSMIWPRKRMESFENSHFLLSVRPASCSPFHGLSKALIM